MRYILFLPLFLCALCGHGQVSVNILVPPSGMMDKQQLWNIIVTNIEPAALSVQLQVNFSELSTGQPVFSASTGPVLINAGTKQLSASTIGAVQYNSLNGNYRIDPGPTGLLPVGSFMVCYDFLILKYNKVVQECQPLNIPPLGPLLLNQPVNGSTVQELHPLFTWLPPSPVQSLTNLRYDVKYVEVLSNQSAADAIQDNIPLFITRNVVSGNYQYMQSAPALLPGRTYAWQVTAMNNQSEIAKSESWSFTTKQETSPVIFSKPDPSYIKLKKGGAQDGYAVFTNNIRFDYLNETTDNIWKVRVEDLSEARHESFMLVLDSTKLSRGQNLVNYDAAADRRFVDKHQYLLQVINSRNEVWQLRFEYRKQD
jgi:hypothetical protein